MNRFLTKLQKQELGYALVAAGSATSDFIFKEDVTIDGAQFAKLTYRESPDTLTIGSRSDGRYVVNVTVPGTSQRRTHAPLRWPEVKATTRQWAETVKLESEAVDPWEQEAENMANDDSYFSADELSRVDRAIDVSLADLQRRAIEAGKQQEQIEGELGEIKHLLKKSARNSTKREWLSLFKGIILEKLLDWGMQTQVFQDILHTLISSAQDIAQLAEHAARHLT